jgi:hypothetical protein
MDHGWWINCLFLTTSTTVIHTTTRIFSEKKKADESEEYILTMHIGFFLLLISGRFR